MKLADLTEILSCVGRGHPDLVQDEKVRRYILLVVEEARKAERKPATAISFGPPPQTIPLAWAPVDTSEI